MREREREVEREKGSKLLEQDIEQSFEMREKCVQVQHTAFHHHTSTHLSIFFEDFHYLMLAI